MTRALALLLLFGSCIPALADDGPPKLDISATCKSNAGAQVRIGENAGNEGCMRSEREAEDGLKQRWGEFSEAAKKQCASQSQAGGFPSYVETLTCLELASGTGPKPLDGRAQPKKADEGGSSLVTEPSPKQRTNPIDVLNDKD